MKYKCVECGKVHESEAEMKFCLDCGKEVKVYEGDNDNDVLKGVKEVVADGVKDIKESVDDVSARVKALEDAPAKIAMPSVKIGSRESYKGFKLEKQGRELREKFAKNPHRYTTLSDPEKMDDYAKFMIDFAKASFGDLGAKQSLHERKTAMQGGTDSLGGYTIPDEFDADMIMLIEDASFAMQECTRVSMKHRLLDTPKELTRAGTAYWVAELGTGTATNSTFGNLQLTAQKLFGLTDYVSQELIDDSANDIVGLLTRQFAYGQAQEIDNQVLNGTGSPVSGMLTANAGYSVVMSADAFSTISETNISLAMSKLKSADLNNAKWIYNKLIQHYIRTLKDSEDRPIYQFPNSTDPGSIYGVPRIESENAPSATGASTAFMVLGDWKQFRIGVRKEAFTLDVDPYSGFNADKVRFRMIKRYALAPARTDAFVRVMTSA